MWQLTRYSTILIFVLATSTLIAGCVQNPTDSSKVATLYRNSPTPAPSPEITLETTAEVVPSPALQIENSPLPLVTQPPVASPSPSATVLPNDNLFGENPATAVVTTDTTLMIPVVGVQNKDLTDTFTQSRSDGRVHDAIDIMAAGGTPVVAVTDGKLVEFFDSERGGITIYQLSPDEKTVYYYAHLERRADNIQKGSFVKQGTLIGYVGDTGNSGAGNYHLHFAVSLITDSKKIHDGTAINPYPLLKNAKPAKTFNSQQ